MGPSLSIVIPCYNEALRLPKAQTAIAEFFPDASELKEIIIVSDGSRDATVEVIKQWQQRDERVRLLEHFPNRGKGYAVKKGMLAATSEWVLFMDADMATPMHCWKNFRPYLRDHAVLTGTRKGQGAVVDKRQPWLREHMGKVFTLLSCVILGVWISDFTCGFKAFRQDACREVFGRQTLFDWSYDSELMFLTRRLQFKMREVPVSWSDDEHTKVSLIRDSAKAFWGLLKIRAHAALGHYAHATPL